MPTILSLDELVEQEYERERLGSDDMTIGTCCQIYIATLLEELPDERTEQGYYDEHSRDLVSIFANAA